MFCYTITLKVFSLQFKIQANYSFELKKKNLSEIIEIYYETVSGALADEDFILIYTSLQESPKD
jgi:hypothetical protein